MPELEYVVGGVVVGQPDVRVAARVEAGAAAHGQDIGLFPGEGEAGLKQPFTIQVGGIAEAVVGHKLRIFFGTVVSAVPVVTQPRNDGQPVSQPEFILGIDGIQRISPIGRSIRRVIGGCIVIVNRSRVSIAEILDTPETNLRFSVLDEHVENIQGFRFQAECELVSIQVILGFQGGSQYIIVQLVGLAAVITPQVHVHRVELNANFPEIRPSHGNLPVVEVQVAQSELRGEVIGPVRIERRHPGVQFRAALIQVVGELELVVVAVGLDEVMAVVVVPGNRETLRIRDVPVQFHQYLFIRITHAGRDRPRIVLVAVAGNSVNFVQFFPGNVYFIYRTGTGRAAVEQVGAFQFLVGGKEKQPVRDDGAADIQAVAFFVVVSGLDCITFQGITAQLITGVIEKQGAAEPAAAGFGHRIDVARRETAVFDVERGQFDGYLAYGVIRKRHPLGRIAVGIQTKGIIHAHAVNGQAVET